MLSSLAWVYNVYCFVFIPQNAQTTQKPTGFKLFESTEWPTLREARIHRNDCLRRQGGEPC